MGVSRLKALFKYIVMDTCWIFLKLCAGYYRLRCSFVAFGLKELHETPQLAAFILLGVAIQSDRLLKGHSGLVDVNGRDHHRT